MPHHDHRHVAAAGQAHQQLGATRRRRPPSGSGPGADRAGPRSRRAAPRRRPRRQWHPPVHRVRRHRMPRLPGRGGEQRADPHPVLGRVGPPLGRRRVGQRPRGGHRPGSWSRWMRRRQCVVTEASSTTRAAPVPGIRAGASFAVAVTGPRVATTPDSSGDAPPAPPRDPTSTPATRRAHPAAAPASRYKWPANVTFGDGRRAAPIVTFAGQNVPTRAYPRRARRSGRATIRDDRLAGGGWSPSWRPAGVPRDRASGARPSRGHGEEERDEAASGAGSAVATAARTAVDAAVAGEVGAVATKAAGSATKGRAGPPARPVPPPSRPARTSAAAGGR